ncbi:hypothetical protein B0T16DRAFT_150799 [Cercophora newfieldiana]|uniref:Uncharacterized protein n=1 Tax=Cercophora newfieldiana TaxID=92897 RepID=A0AA39Y4P5_9PEZI|nr:hypothetical protein B0T16DRAFT_150799 [Cercophora newfieldiana]
MASGWGPSRGSGNYGGRGGHFSNGGRENFGPRGRGGYGGVSGFGQRSSLQPAEDREVNDFFSVAESTTRGTVTFYGDETTAASTNPNHGATAMAATNGLPRSSGANQELPQSTQTPANMNGNAQINLEEFQRLLHEQHSQVQALLQEASEAAQAAEKERKIAEEMRQTAEKMREEAEELRRAAQEDRDEARRVLQQAQQPPSSGYDFQYGGPRGSPAFSHGRQYNHGGPRVQAQFGQGPNRPHNFVGVDDEAVRDFFTGNDAPPRGEVIFYQSEHSGTEENRTGEQGRR